MIFLCFPDNVTLKKSNRNELMKELTAGRQPEEEGEDSSNNNNNTKPVRSPQEEEEERRVSRKIE